MARRRETISAVRVGERSVVVGVERVMTVSTPAGAVLGYLTDLGHSEIWDPGTKSCTRSDDGGPIEVGSAWQKVTVFNGWETEIVFTLVDRDASRLVFEGETNTVTVTDTIVVEADEDGGSTVTYLTGVRFKGLLKLAGPFLRREFERLGDEVERTLPPVLEKLP